MKKIKKYIKQIKKTYEQKIRRSLIKLKLSSIPIKLLSNPFININKWEQRFWSSSHQKLLKLYSLGQIWIYIADNQFFFVENDDYDLVTKLNQINWNYFLH